MLSNFLQKGLSFLGLEPKNKGKRHFDAASTGRIFQNWRPASSSADSVLTMTLETLRNRSRDLAYNSPYIRKYLRECGKNVIGANGFQLIASAVDYNPTTGSFTLDTRANQQIEQAWGNWCKAGNCDVTERYSFWKIQQIILEQTVRDGEVLVLFLATGNKQNPLKIQLIEADHLDEKYNTTLPNGNSIRMGVEKSPSGKVLAYHIRENHPHDVYYMSANYTRRKRIPASNVLHIYDETRLHVSRGYPWITPVMAMLKELERYMKAELTNSELSACKMGFYLEKPDADSYQGSDHEEEDDPDYAEQLEPGVIQRLAPGVDFKSFDPNNPNPNFTPFVKGVLKAIASGLGISYSTLANDLSESNYSSERSSLLQDREEWLRVQRWYTDTVLTPIFERWLFANLATKAIALPVQKFEKFKQVSWQGRRWDWVDPQKDTQANILQISAGLKSISMVAREKGTSVEDIAKELAADKKAFADAGLDEVFDSIFKKKESLSDAQNEEASSGGNNSGKGSGKG